MGKHTRSGNGRVATALKLELRARGVKGWNKMKKADLWDAVEALERGLAYRIERQVRQGTWVSPVPVKVRAPRQPKSPSPASDPHAWYYDGTNGRLKSVAQAQAANWEGIDLGEPLYYCNGIFVRFVAYDPMMGQALLVSDDRFEEIRQAEAELVSTWFSRPATAK